MHCILGNRDVLHKEYIEASHNAYMHACKHKCAKKIVQHNRTIKHSDRRNHKARLSGQNRRPRCQGYAKRTLNLMENDEMGELHWCGSDSSRWEWHNEQWKCISLLLARYVITVSTVRCRTVILLRRLEAFETWNILNWLAWLLCLAKYCYLLHTQCNKNGSKSEPIQSILFKKNISYWSNYVQ